MSLLDVDQTLSPENLESNGWSEIPDFVREQYRRMPHELQCDGSIYLVKHKLMTAKKTVTSLRNPYITEINSFCDVLVGYRIIPVISAGCIHPKLLKIWFIWVPQLKLAQDVNDLSDISVVLHNFGIKDEFTRL